LFSRHFVDRFVFKAVMYDAYTYIIRQVPVSLLDDWTGSTISCSVARQGFDNAQCAGWYQDRLWSRNTKKRDIRQSGLLNYILTGWFWRGICPSPHGI